MAHPAAAGHAATIRRFFDAEALEYAQARERQPSFVAQRELVLGMLPARLERVLDVGCGPALMADPLLRRGAQVCGIDAADEMIRLGRARMRHHPLAARLLLRVGSADRLPFGDASFDAAVAMGVLEYLDDRAAGLAEIARVLRPNGVLVATVPSCLSAYHLARSVWTGARGAARMLLRRAAPPFEAFPTHRCIPWRLDAELERAGLRKTEGRFCNFIFFPLHELVPGASAALNRRLSWLGASPGLAWLGTQYVVRAIKRSLQR